MRVELIRPTVKHEMCKHECQQAKDYQVWPKHSCSPICVYLSDASQLQDGQKFDEGGVIEHPQPE